MQPILSQPRLVKGSLVEHTYKWLTRGIFMPGIEIECCFFTTRLKYEIVDNSKTPGNVAKKIKYYLIYLQ